MRSIFAKTLYDLRWTIAAFCVGLSVLTFAILAIYPEVARAQEDMLGGLAEGTAQALLGSTKWVGTPEGYLNVQVFSFQPLYLAIFLIIATSAAVAGEEGEKTLGLLLARPVSRVRVLVEKALAIIVGLVLISVATAAGALAGAAYAGVEVDMLKLGLALIAPIPFGLWVLGFGLFCSAIFRSRLTAALACTFVVVAGYMINSLTEFVASLERWARFSPVYYYAWGDPLLDAFEWGDAALLVGTGAALLLLALVAFERREVVG